MEAVGEAVESGAPVELERSDVVDRCVHEHLVDSPQRQPPEGVVDERSADSTALVVRVDGESLQKPLASVAAGDCVCGDVIVSAPPGAVVRCRVADVGDRIAVE